MNLSYIILDGNKSFFLILVP